MNTQRALAWALVLVAAAFASVSQTAPPSGVTVIRAGHVDRRRIRLCRVRTR